MGGHMFRWQVGCAVLLGLSALPAAPDLKPETVAAFNRYVSVTEAQRASASGFLWVDGDGRPSGGPSPSSGEPVSPSRR